MHQTVKVGTVGSVGDLARIARKLADEGYDIRAVGGAEANLRGGGVGVMSFLVEPDDPARLTGLVDLLMGLALDGGRTPTQVEIHPGFDLLLNDQVGALATAAELLGEDRGTDDPPINIMSALLVDVHDSWGIVSLSFEDDATRDRAIARVDGQSGLRVMDQHGGRTTRARVDRQIRGKVKPAGDPDEDQDDGPGHGH
jgi:hypothetical protein